MELRNAVSAKFGIELPATATFDHPTALALAAFVAARMNPSPAGVETGGFADWPSQGAAAAAQEAVQRRLQEVADELLGGPVAPDAPLMEAGLDSIGGFLLRPQQTVQH